MCKTKKNNNTNKDGFKRIESFKIKGGAKGNRIVYADDTPCRTLKKGMFKELVVHDGTLVPVMDKKVERHTYFIVGPSGAGKSYYAASLLREYKKKHSKNPIFLVSPKTEDPVLDKLNPLRVKMNSEIFNPDNPLLQLPEITNSIWVFDDCEGINDSQLKQLIYAFRDKLLTVGRSYRISVISIHHLMLNNRETKTCIYESQNLVFFPSSGVNYQLNNYFKRYLGLSQEDIKRINSLPSRAVLIHQLKPGPRYVLSRDEAYII